MKTCSRCGQSKAASGFYARTAKCVVCTIEAVKLNRLAKLDAIRAYDRQRSKLPHRIANATRVTGQWRKKHRDRQAAHNAAQRAKLVRPLLCESCRETKRVEKHHPDYSQPLLVEWLCKPCHAAADKVRRSAESAA